MSWGAAATRASSVRLITLGTISAASTARIATTPTSLLRVYARVWAHLLDPPFAAPEKTNCVGPGIGLLSLLNARRVKDPPAALASSGIRRSGARSRADRGARRRRR